MLLKIRNRGGPSGFSLAIAQRNGTPLPGRTPDVEPPATKFAAIDAPGSRRWSSRFVLQADRAGANKKLGETVGDWRVRNHARQQATELSGGGMYDSALPLVVRSTSSRSGVVCR